MGGRTRFDANNNRPWLCEQSLCCEYARDWENSFLYESTSASPVRNQVEMTPIDAPGERGRFYMGNPCPTISGGQQETLCDDCSYRAYRKFMDVWEGIPVTTGFGRDREFLIAKRRSYRLIGVVVDREPVGTSARDAVTIRRDHPLRTPNRSCGPELAVGVVYQRCTETRLRPVGEGYVDRQFTMVSL